MDFLDRLLVCGDCNEGFVFTAGEQLFFHDKQFKNDPKRCKPCKSKRLTAMGRTTAAPGSPLLAAGMARTETRTECSACGVETTVPFKPTQGRPVLCRQCFQMRSPLVADSAAMVANAERTLMQRAGLGAAGLSNGSAERLRAVTTMREATSELVAAAASETASATAPELASLPTPS